MTFRFLLAVLMVAAAADCASAKKLGDVLNAIGDIGKAVSKEKKDAGRDSAPADGAAARDQGGEKKSSGIGKVLKAVGVKGKTAEGIEKGVDFGGRTKKNIDSAKDLFPADEWQIGRVVSAEILHKYGPVTDPGLNGYVQTVGQAVAMNSDLPQTFRGYFFQVLDTEEINAVSVTGGFIFVTKGLLRLLENEDQLACVLAHEVAHVALGHGSTAIIKARRMKAGLSIAADAQDTFGSGSKLAGQLKALRGDVKSVMEILDRTGYGQDKEFEADEKGAVYAQRTGYDPAAMAAVLRKIEASSAAQGGFLKTHPRADKRAARLEEEPLEAVSWYRASKVRERRFAAALAALGGSGE